MCGNSTPCYDCTVPQTIAGLTPICTKLLNINSVDTFLEVPRANVLPVDSASWATGTCMMALSKYCAAMNSRPDSRPVFSITFMILVYSMTKKHVFSLSICLA